MKVGAPHSDCAVWQPRDIPTRETESAAQIKPRTTSRRKTYATIDNLAWFPPVRAILPNEAAEGEQENLHDDTPPPPPGCSACGFFFKYLAANPPSAMTNSMNNFFPATNRE